jgi:hypothetical protein
MLTQKNIHQVREPETARNILNAIGFGRELTVKTEKDVQPILS